MSLLAIACLAGNSWWTLKNIAHLVEVGEWVERTADIQFELAKVETELVNAETGQRGYVLTANTDYLEPYYAGLRNSGVRLSKLESMLDDAAVVGSQTSALRGAVDAKFSEMASVLNIMTLQGDDAARERISTGAGKALMQDVRAAVATIERSLEADLQRQKAQVSSARSGVISALSVFICGTLLLIALLFLTSRRELSRREKDAAAIKDTAHSLKISVAELRKERNEIQGLNEAAGFMQSCDTVSELAHLLAPILERMFDDFAGEVFLHAPSRNRLDCVVSFGGGATSQHIAPNDCWALRRGQDHKRMEGDGSPACAHHHGSEDPVHSTLCIPLVAHGDTIGLFALTLKALREHGETQALLENAQRLATMFGAQLGLTLSNLKLRDTLRQQAIRDPLTDAFNRRYLDAIGEKILAQADRFGKGLAVVMLDVDHFKQFNDMHGHVAGDHALVTIAHFIQSYIREADWLFRYGGEEFLIVMQGIDHNSAVDKLNALCKSVSELQLTNGDAVLPPVTISLGCAFYPDHASTLPDLISLADQALYEAKHGGRNQLRLAQDLPLASAGMSR